MTEIKIGNEFEVQDFIGIWIVANEWGLGFGDFHLRIAIEIVEGQVRFIPGQVG